MLLIRLSKEERREQLLEVATAIFVEKGYHETTTKEIAEKARVSEAVIYKHFTSKKELFFEVIYNNIVSKSFENLQISSGLTLEEFLERFIQQHLTNMEKNFKMLLFMIIQILQDEEIRAEYYTNFLPKISKLILPYLNKINQDKLNNYSTSFNGILLAGMIIPFGLARGLFDFIPEDLSNEELSQRLIQVYLRAINAKKEA